MYGIAVPRLPENWLVSVVLFDPFSECYTVVTVPDLTLMQFAKLCESQLGMSVRGPFLAGGGWGE